MLYMRRMWTLLFLSVFGVGLLGTSFPWNTQNFESIRDTLKTKRFLGGNIKFARWRGGAGIHDIRGGVAEAVGASEIRQRMQSVNVKDDNGNGDDDARKNEKEKWSLDSLRASKQAMRVRILPPDLRKELGLHAKELLSHLPLPGQPEEFLDEHVLGTLFEECQLNFDAMDVSRIVQILGVEYVPTALKSMVNGAANYDAKPKHLVSSTTLALAITQAQFVNFENETHDDHQYDTYGGEGPQYENGGRQTHSQQRFTVKQERDEKREEEGLPLKKLQETHSGESDIEKGGQLENDDENDDDKDIKTTATPEATSAVTGRVANHDDDVGQQPPADHKKESSPAASVPSARRPALTCPGNVEDNLGTTGVDEEKSRQDWLFDQMRQTWDHLNPAEKRRVKTTERCV